MAASISAVAAICASAPSSTQAQKIAGGRGSATPVASSTTARKTSANGSPNRKRTWVAPTVPSVVGQLALRGVAHGLARRRDDGEEGPEPEVASPESITKGAAFSAVSM